MGTSAFFTPGARRADDEHTSPPNLAAQMMIDEYPMLFEISNVKQKKKTHCGVLEFVAEEGVIYLPYWMMQNLLLSEGDILKIQYTKLPKGNYVKLRPQTKDFLDITNPKAVLETTLRSYTCLTVGDSILINYNNRRYFIDIIEARPNDAVSIVDTDCEVDFAPPLDYVEPSPVKPPVVKPESAEGGASGSGADKGKEAEAEVVDVGGPKFLAFAGGGNRLDGKNSKSDLKPVEVDLPTTSLNVSKEFERFIRGPKTEEGAAKKPEGSGSGLPRRKAGKLVFGGAKAAKEEKKTEEKKEEEAPKFKAFQGTGNRLK